MDPDRDRDDEALMQRVLRGDAAAEAFEHLYDRLRPSAMSIALSVLNDLHHAEDAVQEAFLSLWRGRETYRDSQRTSFRAWALATVRNRALDRRRWLRARPPGSKLDDAEDSRADPEGLSPAQELLTRERWRIVQAALARLPEEQAEVIVLAYYGELSVREIAVELQLSLGTAKGRMRLGLEKLRRDLSALAPGRDREMS